MGLFDIFLSPVNRKFNTAVELCKSRHYIAAIAQFKEIEKEHAEAATKIAECTYNLHPDKLGEGHYADCLTIINKRALLPSVSNQSSFNLVVAKCYLDVATYQFRKRSTKGDQRLLDLENNIKFIDKAIKAGLDIHFQKLIQEHYPILVSDYKSIGIDYEKNDDISKAIEAYDTALGFQKKITDSGGEENYELLTRRAICEMKNGAMPSTRSVENILSKPTTSLEFYDFCYRCAVLFIKIKYYAQAQKFIEKLPPLYPETRALIQILEKDSLIEAKRRLTNINWLVQELVKHNFPVFETRALLEALPADMTFIVKYIPALDSKLNALWFTLFSKLQLAFLAAKDYENAANLITGYDRFWESKDLLKNLAVSYAGMLKMKLASEENYKSIVAGWLTAITNEQIILNSLMHTTWNDDYSFTLIETIRANDKYHDDRLTNVNYEEVSPNNISIGDVQHILSENFEKLLRSAAAKFWSEEEVYAFYESEKMATENLARVIPAPGFLASPHFASLNALSDKIINELAALYTSSGDENILIAGLPYLEGNHPAVFKEYAQASKSKEGLIDALTKRNASIIGNFNNSANIKLLAKYKTIAENLERWVENWLQELIDTDQFEDSIIPILGHVIEILPNAFAVRILYVEYIRVWCVRKLNAENMRNLDALDWLARIYEKNTNESRLCEDLVELIGRNLIAIVVKETTGKEKEKIFKILDKVKANKSQMFISRAAILGQTLIKVLEYLGEENCNAIINNLPLSDIGKDWSRCLDYLSDFSGVPLR